VSGHIISVVGYDADHCNPALLPPVNDRRFAKNNANSAFKMRDRLKRWGNTVMEARIVLLRTHQKNMDRYEGLLETKLSEVERQYIEKRMSEERLAIAMLVNAPRHR